MIGVYKITNTVTGEFYIGSSQYIERRWYAHKKPGTWKQYPNSRLYNDMKELGIDKFTFEIVEETTIEDKKIREQFYIESLLPTYNQLRATGRKDYHEQNRKSVKRYYSQMCLYEGKLISMHNLSTRFVRMHIPHPTLEAKKYLVD